MRIVVSGATGFLGGHVARALVHAGHQVDGLGRDRDKGVKLRAFGINYETVDLSELVNFSQIPAADAFVHCAGLSSPWGRRGDFEQANIVGTFNALRLAERYGVKRFIMISSPSVLFRYRDQLDVNETAPLPPPVNDYAATKVIAEDLVRSSKLGCVILRPRALYGPGDVALLPRLIKVAQKGAVPLLRDGAALTDLTYIEDAVQAVLLALKAGPVARGKTYHISGGQPLAIKDIITGAARAAGLNPRFKPVSVAAALNAARFAEGWSRLQRDWPEPAITMYGVGVLAYSQTLDISAARKDLGYAPQIRFEEGLQRTFALQPA
jgi:nucleoside-diphosphate-sugar epimerase